jgi:hypothetical protein
VTAANSGRDSEERYRVQRGYVAGCDTSAPGRPACQVLDCLPKIRHREFGVEAGLILELSPTWNRRGIKKVVVEIPDIRNLVQCSRSSNREWYLRLANAFHKGFRSLGRRRIGIFECYGSIAIGRFCCGCLSKHCRWHWSWSRCLVKWINLSGKRHVGIRSWW